MTLRKVLHGRDLTRKVCVITGANRGIGFETAKSLCKHGSFVVMCCRDTTAAMYIVEDMGFKTRPMLLDLDLADLQSVKLCAMIVAKLCYRIDMLILNAGTFGQEFTKTKDGYEAHFQVNHLGHFYFAELLRPLLRAGSRVVVVSSESHRFANLTEKNISPSFLSPDTGAKYCSMTAYNNSKLCNVLFARRLARNLQEEGISVFSLHPGNMVSTHLPRHWWVYRLFFFLVRPFTKSLQQAASTTVFCATAPELSGTTGVYFNNCFRCEESKTAQDDRLADKLWRYSVEMIEQALGPDAFDFRNITLNLANMTIMDKADSGLTTVGNISKLQQI